MTEEILEPVYKTILVEKKIIKEKQVQLPSSFQRFGAINLLQSDNDWIRYVNMYGVETFKFRNKLSNIEKIINALKQDSNVKISGDDIPTTTFEEETIYEEQIVLDTNPIQGS